MILGKDLVQVYLILDYNLIRLNYYKKTKN